MGSINFSVGNQQLNANLEQTVSFLTHVKEAGDIAIQQHRDPESITTFVSEKFNEMTIDMDLQMTKSVMEQIREKIPAFGDEDLTQLFNQTLQVVSNLKKTFPYMGTWKGVFGACRTAFKNAKKGAYAFYKKDEIITVVISGGKLKETDPAPQLREVSLIPDKQSGKYKAKDGKNEEEFDSFIHFLDEWTKKGELKEPLVQEEPYNFEKTVAEQLKQQPYFAELTSQNAIRVIEGQKAGTYLIRDKDKDPDTKVIVYIDSSGNIQELVLEPCYDHFKGFNCKGKWYADVNVLLYNDPNIRPLLTEKFKFPMENIEDQFKIMQAFTGESFDVSEIIPLERKIELFTTYRERLETGASIQELLSEALSKREFEVAKWLAIQAGSLKGIDRNAIDTDLLLWLERYLQKPDPNPTTLDDYALKIGYGYKSSNLMVQERLVNELNKKLTSSQVEVPSFLPFSDFEMRHHMQPILSDIEILWKAFLETFDKDQALEIQKEGYDPIASPIMVKPNGMPILEEIHTKIVKFFIEHPYESPELQDWVEKHKPDFLIIRSTGKEDTEQNPNPGGNETIPYVKPEALAISKAIGEVIASYFGIKSISQRLMVGDKSLFTDPAFVPVLIMKMVTEKVNGEDDRDDVTRSGVMFTRQKGKAEDVTLLQVGLGNNEGVVASKVAVDTHYIDKDRHIMSVIREKKTRFLPLQLLDSDHVMVGSKNNDDPELESSQALPDAVIRDMKVVADFFAEVYGSQGMPSSMDLEYTIKLNGGGKGNPIISLLQIRPLVEKQDLRPSYLNLVALEDIPVDSKMSVKTLLGGDSSVQNIAISADVMFADNLTQGLARYLNKTYETITIGTPEKKDVELLPKVIFTQKTAHLTSHEAIFFRKRGVVVFVVDNPNDLKKIKQMVSQANPANPLKADPQRGLLVETRKVPSHQEMEVQGYISYPIPREITLPKGLFTPTSGGYSQQEVALNFAHLNERYQKLDVQLKGNQHYIIDKTLRELFDLVASSGDEQEAKLALATILKMLINDLNQTMKKIDPASKNLVVTLLQLFDAATTLSEEQILPSLSKKPGDLSRLFALKFLDALIFQNEQAGIVDGCSWINVKSSERTEKKMLAMTEEFSMPVQRGKKAEWQLQMQKLASVGFNKEIRKNWMSFVSQIVEADLEERRTATILIIEIVKMNMSNEWINLVFNPLWKKTAEGSDRASKVLKSLCDAKENDRETLIWTRQQMDQLEIQRMQIAEWSNPDYVEKNLLKLRGLFIKEFGFFERGKKPSFVERYEKSDTLGKLSLMEFYRQAVDVYDKTIKSVTGSVEYPEDNWKKVEHFARLLIGYHRMLEGSFQLISKEEEKNLMSFAFDGGNQQNFQIILSGLEYGRNMYGYSDRTLGLAGQLKEIHLKKADPKELLETSSGFIVEPMIIGSHNDLSYGVEWPNTLEEIFTTIHQNLEKIGKHLITKTGLSEELLEGDAKEFNQQVSKIFGKENFSQMSLKASQMEIVYQIPLRQHSGALSFSFDINHPEKGITLSVSIYGKDERYRWQQGAVYGAFLGNIGIATVPQGFPPKIDYNNPRGCTFTLHLPQAVSEDQSYKEKRKVLLEQIDYVMRTVTFGQTSWGANLSDQDIFQNMEEVLLNLKLNWDGVNEAFFGQSLHFGTLLMENFYKKGNYSLLYKVCQGAFHALLNYGLDDYEIQSNVPKTMLEGYFNVSKYGAVPDNGKKERSLKLAATLFLIKGMHEQRELVEPIVKELISNPEMTTQFPNTVKVLEGLIA